MVRHVTCLCPQGSGPSRCTPIVHQLQCPRQCHTDTSSTARPRHAAPVAMHTSSMAGCPAKPGLLPPAKRLPCNMQLAMDVKKTKHFDPAAKASKQAVSGCIAAAEREPAREEELLAMISHPPYAAGSEGAVVIHAQHTPAARRAHTHVRRLQLHTKCG